MDLIIEFIVWVFKALTGEDNKAKNLPKGGSTPQRGPYNYGDGRGAAGRPKTLEEILEEVKRQQAQGKAPAPRAAPPRPPAAPAKTPSLSRPLSEVQSASPRPAQGGAIQSKIETREMKQTIDARETVKPGLEKKFEKLEQREDQRALGIGQTKMVAEVNTLKSGREVQTIVNMEAGLADKKINTYADLFKAMRASAPKSRMEMARRAFVFSEVFGPPRSHRPHRRR